jgi:hypothetical protein
MQGKRKEKGKETREEKRRDKRDAPQTHVSQGVGMRLLITVMSMRLETRALAPAAKAGSQPGDRQEEGHCLDLLACQLHLLHP